MAVVQGFDSWLRVTPELVYGTYNTAGTGTFWIRLTGDTSFNPKKAPVRTQIRSADASNRRVTNISSKYTVGGSLSTPLYPSQAAEMMAMAATLSGSPLDLGSYTFDFFDTQAVRRYLGGKVQTFGLEASGDNQFAMLNYGLVFQSVADGVTLAQPALTVFPAESPYLFTESAGFFTLGSTPVVITQYDSFSLNIANTVDAKHYEAATIAFAKWCGRDVNFSSHLTYVDTSYRTAYEAQTAETFVFQFFRSSTKTLTLTFETATILADRDQTLPLGGVSEQSISAEVFFDVTADTGAGQDFEFTALYS